MKTNTGYKAAGIIAILLAIAVTASVAEAQVAVQTSVTGSAGGSAKASINANANIKASTTSSASATSTINMKASTAPNASATGTMHANENSAVIRGNDPQGNASTTASIATPRKVPARFLGLFGTEITAKVITNADGTVKVRYPWYSFLFRLSANASTSASVR